MTPQRPALADVLAALDAPTADGLTVGDGPAMSPVEAVEALATGRLWPWEPGDDPTRWWCERCEGIGLLCTTDGENVFDTPCRCRGNPPTLADLVSVASLGAPQLARCAHLAGEIARAAGCAGARVVFRAVSRETLRAWTEERVYRDGDASLAYVTAHEALGGPNASPLRYGGPEPWPVSFPWLGLSGNHVARRHWSVVRDLGLLGAMLVDLSGDRVTLAVEAVS